MNIRELRIGNLIKISPRENQEGLLQIAEIHKESLIGEMLSPRQGYQFRIKFHEIIDILLTPEWLLQAGFELDDENIYRHQGFIDFWFKTDVKQFYRQGVIASRPVETVSQLQNGYLFLTGEELIINGPFDQFIKSPQP